MDDQVGTSHDGLGAVVTPAFSGAATARRIAQPDADRAPNWPIDPNLRFDELDLEFDEEDRILWAYQLHNERPNFTPRLIRDIGRLEDEVVRAGADALPVDYLVWASRKPNIFNLGGDLGLFVELIEAGDREGLTSYALSCVDICFRNAVNLNLPILTAALVQGDALGGGFESALSSDIIVAERGAQFGFPEILFGLFPGMGAYTLLARRAGVLEAERMIFSGRLYKASELHELGIVDVLADNGQGEAALRDHVARNRRRHGAMKALYGVRQRFNPVTREEMVEIAEKWVETALTLDESNRKKMRRLARAQQRRIGGGDEAEAANEAAPVERAADELPRVMPFPGRTRPASEAEPAQNAAGEATSGDDGDEDTGAERGGTATRHRPNYERILRELAPDRAAAVQQPGVRRLLSEGTDRETYLEFLGELYHVVKHFCPTMEVAAAQCGEDQAPLRAHLEHSIEEERGHDAWVLKDIEDLGGDPEATMNSSPSVPVQAMLGYNYNQAERGNPWSAMGMVYVLEEIAANYASRVARRVAERLGITSGEGFSFLSSHGEMDQVHVEEFKDLTDFCTRRADQDALIEAARVNYALFGALFREE